MNLTIKQKLMGSFLIVAIVFGLASFISYQTIKETTESYDYLIDTVSKLNGITQSIETETALQISYYRAYMLYENPEYKDEFDQARTKIDALIQEGKELSTLQETQDRLDSINKSNNEFYQVASQVMDLSTIDKQQATERGLREITPITTKLTDDSHSLYTWLLEIENEKVKETRDHSKAGITTVMMISVIAALIAISSGVIISIFISRPIVKLNHLVKQLASGDLNVERLTIKSKDEIYFLNESFKQMTDHLRKMISTISSHATQVAASSEQLTASAEQSSTAAETVTFAIQGVASGSEVTTSNLESTSRSLEEVLQGALRISERSANVAELSRKTTTEAEVGGRFVEDNLKQMKFIHESISRSNQAIKALSERSQEIGEILDVISNIADQTNLLALNATIEAARAGEHGKGFAVVADEIRKLAEQSQVSTKNIDHLIRMIQKDTEESVKIMSEVMTNAQDGVKVSEQTSDKFTQILNSTRDISPQVEEVTATIQQISASIEEMSASANEMVKQAQEIAANSEEVAASTEEQLASMEEINSSAQYLASTAEELRTLVSQFKLS